MDAVAIWSEYGAIGVCIALLGFTQVFLQRTLVSHLDDLGEKLDNLYEINCKLIEKHKKINDKQIYNFNLKSPIIGMYLYKT